MLKYAVCLLVFCLAVSADTTDSETNISFCQTSLSEKCLDGNLRHTRSIDHPISEFKNALNIESNSSTIQCADKSLVLNIVKASVSNLDRSKCSGLDQVKTIECTDRIMTTILASRMCNGKNVCTFSVDNDFASLCECTPQKYLDLTYTCVKASDVIEDIKSVSKRFIRMNYNRLDDYEGPGYGPSKDSSYSKYGQDSKSSPTYDKDSSSYSKYGQDSKSSSTYGKDTSKYSKYGQNSSPSSKYGQGSSSSSKYDGSKPAPSYKEYAKNKYPGSSSNSKYNMVGSSRGGPDSEPEDNYSKMVGSRNQRVGSSRRGSPRRGPGRNGPARRRPNSQNDDKKPVVGSSYHGSKGSGYHGSKHGYNDRNRRNRYRDDYPDYYYDDYFYDDYYYYPDYYYGDYYSDDYFY